jgi:hypothetical protein
MFDRIARGIVPCVRSPDSGGRTHERVRRRVERIVLLVISNRTTRP